MPHCTSTTHLLPGTSCAGSCKFALDTEDHPPPKSIWHRHNFHCAEELHREGGNFQWPAAVASVGSGAALSFQHWWQPLLPLPPIPSLPVSEWLLTTDGFPASAPTSAEIGAKEGSFCLLLWGQRVEINRLRSLSHSSRKLSNSQIVMFYVPCHVVIFFSLPSIIFPNFLCFLLFLNLFKGVFSPHLGLIPQTFQWS